MPKNKDVVIIGAGVIGCSIAYHLGKKGISSQIIERESIGSRASGKAWAVIPYPPVFFVEEKFPATSGSDPKDATAGFYAMPEGETLANWIGLHWAGYHQFAGIAMDIKEKTGIDIEYGEGRDTHLVTSETLENISREDMLSLFMEYGAHESEWLDADDLRSCYPSINPKFAGGVSIPEFQVEPYKLTLGLGQAAENMEADIRHGDVVGFGTKGDKIASANLASGTKVEAEAFVLAMGPWSGQGAAFLGSDIPIGLFMTECLRVQPQAALPLHTISYQHQSIIPLVNGSMILAGSSRITRRKKGAFDSQLSEKVGVKTLEDATAMVADLAQASFIEHRGDLLACAPEMPYNKPVLGRLGGWENGYIATRFGGLGICLSPGAGAIMADLIVDGEVPFRAKQVMEHLSPNRL
jgi:glycine/D-amino acid oxidase-like deaminating enzyme